MPPHCSGMFASRTTFVQRAVSALTCCDELLRGRGLHVDGLIGEALARLRRDRAPSGDRREACRTWASARRPACRCRTTTRRRTPARPAPRRSARRGRARCARWTSPRAPRTLPALICGSGPGRLPRHELEVPAHDVGHRDRGAFVRHVHDVDAGHRASAARPTGSATRPRRTSRSSACPDSSSRRRSRPSGFSSPCEGWVTMTFGVVPTIETKAKSRT